jgi:predicted nucleotide-binding protein
MTLETAIKQALAEAFGEGTQTFNRFERAASLDNGPHQVRMGDAFGRGPRIDYESVDAQKARKYLADGKEQSIPLLKEAIRTLEREIADQEAVQGPATSLAATRPVNSSSRKVFVVHGRDNEAKSEVARFLGRIGLEEIILHERPNGGRHLLTKFQEESEGASFAVILMTPDDEGGIAGQPLQKRARQNVVFELGFFIGRLGPACVAALVKGELEKPSDFDGVAYIPLDETGAWKTLLARELHHARVPFDLSKVISA